tara:strand:+ start:2681 stop:3004 length:324 start_codon:yes stop_codon:yes gene_type:complete
MGLRKRRKPISAESIAEDLSIDDMFKYINKEFVSQDSNPVEYVLGICKDIIHREGKTFLLYDSRESLDPDHKDWSWGEELPPFYGKTMREAVSKCYISLKQEELKNK